MYHDDDGSGENGGVGPACKTGVDKWRDIVRGVKSIVLPVELEYLVKVIVLFDPESVLAQKSLCSLHDSINASCILRDNHSPSV